MPLLTDVELEEITGARTPKRQCEVLTENRIPFTKRADGRPRLTLEVYNATLLGHTPRHPQQQQKQSPESTPGFNLRAVS